MFQHLPEELARARDLMDQAKLDNSLEIIEQYENSVSLSSEDQLSALLMKGKVYLYKQRTRKALQAFEVAYEISQDLGLMPDSISALIGKAYIGLLGDLDKASSYVTDAEKRLETIVNDQTINILRRDLLLVKSWVLLYKNKDEEAIDSVKKGLLLTEQKQLGNKLDLALLFFLLGWMNMNQDIGPQALDYTMKSLKLHKELNYAVAIADDYSLIARIYFMEGDYDQAMDYCKQALSIKEISGRSKLETLNTVSDIYFIKGKYNRAIKYRQHGIELAEKFSFNDRLVDHLLDLGIYYAFNEEPSLAIESFERALTLSEKWDFKRLKAFTLNQLFFIFFDLNSHEKANRYFSRLSNLYDQTIDEEDVDIADIYFSAKAYTMKKSSRLRDRIEAQALYKGLLNRAKGVTEVFWHLGHLCDLLIEELSLSNDLEILDEITPLIQKGLEIAEKTRNYYWLAEVKLLQAKLALIQVNFEKARRLLVEAQRIAELHSLDLLAQEVSKEHDKLLEQKDVWDTIKIDDGPMAERIKLASANSVLERIQGKRAVDPPELVNEEPILLLIMDNSGSTYFNHPFVAKWDYSDLFSDFMSAFNTFSSEIFSSSIDRIKVRENTILIHPVENFLVCYVIKGQSYPALQKLTKFAEAIRENSEIWDALEKSVKTSEMLGLNNPPMLKKVINEIFD